MSSGRHSTSVNTRPLSTVLVVGVLALTGSGSSPHAQSVRMGMTWAVLGQTDGYVHVGSDGQTNPYSGDTTADQPLSILCLTVDGRSAPDGIVFDYYNGWAQGAVQVTPVIPGAILTSGKATTDTQRPWALVAQISNTISQLAPADRLFDTG